MYRKKIIGMGILCGLSLSGSVTVNAGTGAQYPVVKYGSTPGGQGYGNGLISDYGRDVQALINNFFPWIDGRDMQAIVQAINDEVTKLVGSNPAPGALVGALLAILAVNVYDCLDASREEIGKLRGALNGTLNPIDQQKLKKELEQQGTEILNLSKSISEQYF